MGIPTKIPHRLLLISENVLLVKSIDTALQREGVVSGHIDLR